MKKKMDLEPAALQVTSLHKLFHFYLPFTCRKEMEKLQKFEYLENEESFLDEIKSTFRSF